MSGPSDRIIFFNTTSGDSLWAVCGDTNRSFFSLAVSEDGNFVGAADGGNDRESPAGKLSTVFLFDKDGSIIWKKQIEIKAQCTPTVRFTGDGMHFLVCNNNRLYCYKIIKEQQ